MTTNWLAAIAGRAWYSSAEPIRRNWASLQRPSPSFTAQRAIPGTSIILPADRAAEQQQRSRQESCPLRMAATAAGRSAFHRRPADSSASADARADAAWPRRLEEWNGFVVPHVITRSVCDSAAFLDVSHGADVGAPYAAPEPARRYSEEVDASPGRMRIACIRASILGDHTHPDCVAAAQDSERLLAHLGHEVEEAKLPISPEEARIAYLTVVAACTAATVDDIARLVGLRPHPRLFEASTWFLWQVGYALTAAELEHARIAIGTISRAMGAFMAKYDMVMTPTMAYPPARIGEYGLTPGERASLAILRMIGPRSVLKRVLTELAGDMLEKTANTMLFNMTGQPAMSVPLWWNGEGLPIGVQFAGRFGDEASLLRLARQLEQERPWFNRRPPL